MCGSQIAEALDNVIHNSSTIEAIGFAKNHNDLHAFLLRRSTNGK
jgi:hypothetical protein